MDRPAFFYSEPVTESDFPLRIDVGVNPGDREMPYLADNETVIVDPNRLALEP